MNVQLLTVPDYDGCYVHEIAASVEGAKAAHEHDDWRLEEGTWVCCSIIERDWTGKATLACSGRIDTIEVLP